MSETVSSRGTGGAFLAGVYMIVVGAMGVLESLAAIAKGSFFVTPQNYFITTGASTWGWIHLLVSIVVLLAGFGVLSGATWARVVGIIIVSVQALTNFLYIPYYPFWALVIIAVDLWVIHALAVHRREVVY